jgi:hypothetical protein
MAKEPTQVSDEMYKPVFESSDSVGKDRNNLLMISVRKAGRNTAQMSS